jgi:DNA polymerase I-like protein with 3'-5' exonuclease and polymerase domains
MIYLVSNQQELFESDEYTAITLEESLEIIKDWKIYQYDSETTGRDAHVNEILCIQIGNLEGTIQLVIDATTIDITKYKDFLENNYCLGQNLKFDLQFLYNYNIIPRKIYDTMIVEQVLYLGYPYNLVTPKFYEENSFDFPYREVYDKEGEFLGWELSFSLKAIAYKYLKIDIDKTVRGEIIWRGLDTSVIKYAAGDVTYLGDIMKSQRTACKIKQCLSAAKLECDFVPVISYLEWCGIKLDIDKWKAKMEIDNKNLEEAISALNDFVIKNPKLKKFVYIEQQGDLFTGFDLTPKVNINWASSAQVVKVAQLLGFDTKVQDKKTGEDKDSVIEKHLKKQKGINDEFLRLYFGKGEPAVEDYFAGYNRTAKVVSSFG